jgi:homoserine dehydrogenase
LRRVDLTLAGFGLIGSEVCRLISANAAFWRSGLDLDVRLVEIRSSRGRLAFDRDGIGPDVIVGLTRQAHPIDDADSGAAAGHGLPILMDAATGTGAVDLAKRFLRDGGCVVYSNKAPLSQATPQASALWDAAGSGKVRYETTCGAGLPVISTVASLLRSGDRVVQITGCLSGTLGAIFSSVADGQPMSTAIRAAKDAGYTEPDPRDDLSGLDVARKALILARTIGRKVDLEDLAIESLVPADLATGSIDEFLDQIAAYDSGIASRQTAAVESGATLKYVATVPADGPIEVGLASVPTTTVLGALQGPENIISIRTERYDRYPLAISGPGAGAAVTAAGMIADMLDLAHAAKES